MNIIWTLAMKDLRILLRDKAGFFFTFFYPMLVAVFMGVIFSGAGGDSGSHASALSIYVVDQDSTEISQRFVDTLAHSEELQITPTRLEQAQEDVRLGKKAAYVLIKKGYSKARENMFTSAAPVVEIGIDPSRRPEASLLTGLLLKYGAQDMQQVFSDRKQMRKQVQASLQSAREHPVGVSANLESFLSSLDSYLADTTSSASERNGHWSGFEPLKIEEKEISRQRIGPPSSFAVTFPQGVMWGIIACTTTFAVSLVTERREGTLMRLLAAPLSSYHLLGSKALACFLTTISVSFIVMLVGILVFGIRVASYFKLALGLVVVAGSFVGVMMLLSVLGKTERATSGIGWGVLMVLAMIGGGMLPLFFMPDWLKALSNISPIKWGILALEGAIWRDFSFQELLPPYLILAAFGSVSFLVGARLFRWSEHT
ncbi:MAG TPA: ABC transporter permease [Bacteroidota bacterium]|nr:ABC transporter permease [Bacteroidota bacterium]